MQTLYFCPVVPISSFYLCIFFFFSSPILSCHKLDLPCFHTWCGLSVNLGCRSEMCCTGFAENTGCSTIAQLCLAISLQLRHLSTIGKSVLNGNTSCTCPHNMVNLWSTNGWDRFGSLGHPSQFQRVSCLGCITAWQSSSGHQPHFAALNRGRHIFGRVAITLGIGPHSSYILHESWTTQNVLWSRASVCLSVCPWPYAHTIARTRI